MRNQYTGNEMSPTECFDIESFIFKNDCSKEKIEAFDALREAGGNMCQLIIAVAPNSADRSSAIRFLRLAVMQAVASIALAK